MLITGTSDLIQFKLGASATTQLPFTVDYNNYTSTGVTLTSNQGTSSNTTAITLVTSPSSGQQNELRYCSIYNADAVTQTITIQVYDGSNTRVVFRAVLASGETLQYQLEKGWEVIDVLGNKKNYAFNSFSSTVNGSWGWRPTAVATNATLTSNTVFFMNLCKAEKSYTSIDVMYNVATVFSAVTWAEAAIFSQQRINGDSALPFTRRGYTDISGVVTSTGIKKTTISVSGISTGELVILALGCSATAGTLRNLGFTSAGTGISANNIDISDSTFGAIGTNTNFRPSLNPYMYYGSYSNVPFWINWQAT